MNTDLGELCFSSECVRNFFGHFKFAITIAGASLPLAALVAAIHRSNEAAVQIQYASKQYSEAVKNNRFGNYLKHREGFEKIVSSHVSNAPHAEGAKPIVTPAYVYAKLFPASGFSAEAWYGEPDGSALGSLEDDIALLMEQIKNEVFDFATFFSAFSRVAAFYDLEFDRVQAVRLVDDPEVIALIPYHHDVPRAIISHLNTLIELHKVVRTYVGKNRSDDLAWNRYINIVYHDLMVSSSLYELDDLALPR